MPKNSAWGVNSKAVEAKERKANQKLSEQEAKQKAIEDNLWKDKNKLDDKKKERKEIEEQKKQELLSRKLESKEMLQKEEESISKKAATSSGKGGGKKKVTMSEIDKIKELERQKQLQRRQQKEKEKSKLVVETPELETENPNRKMAEILEAENAVEARCVDDALSVLSIGDDSSSVDKHPEKRMKAAYNEYVERELPILKQENPNLRLSQLKQILFKQWQKSPDNPMNK